MGKMGAKMGQMGVAGELEEDLRLARAVQSALLPRQFPTFPPGVSPGCSAVRFHAFFRGAPAVGGDFFWVRRLSDCGFGVLMCDVMGRGVRAALLSGMLGALVHSLEDWGAEPGTFLTHLNRALWKVLKGVGSPLFSTACYAVMDLQRGRLRLANAAHPSPVRVSRREGRGISLRKGEGCGPLLGVFESAFYPTWEFPLEGGDVVWLFSDGLQKVENAAGEIFGEDRILEVLEGGPDRLCCRSGEAGWMLVDAMERFSAGHALADDVCLVGVEVERLVDTF